MELLTTLALIAIAALLFYRWVSPSHKRVTGKIALVFVVLASIVGGAIRVGQWRRDLRERADSLVSKAMSDSVAVAEDKRLGHIRVRVAAMRAGDLTIEICNQDSLGVHQTEMLGWGLLRGHSTEYQLLPSYTSASGRSILSSDVVVPPRSCASHAVHIREGVDTVNVVAVRAMFDDGYEAKTRFYDLLAKYWHRQ